MALREIRICYSVILTVSMATKTSELATLTKYLVIKTYSLAMQMGLAVAKIQ